MNSFKSIHNKLIELFDSEVLTYNHKAILSEDQERDLKEAVDKVRLRGRYH